MKEEAYKLAEKKIQQALQSGATELDLSGMNLTELPESLGLLDKLQILNISENSLESLPKWIEQLVQLHSINLYRNVFRKIPEVLLESVS